MSHPHSEKYNILMHYNQFAEAITDTNSAPIHWQDSSELSGINEFEKCCEVLKKEGKQKRTMIELGGNYAYYSMLFAKFFEGEEVENIMVEPYEKYRKIGVHHLKINGLEGTILDRQIYNPAGWWGGRVHFDCPHTTVDELLEEFKICDLDMLHMDIDSSEEIALKGAEKSLSKHLINFVYVATHDDGLHANCGELLSGFGYKQVYECASKTIGHDSLLIFKRGR